MLNLDQSPAVAPEDRVKALAYAIWLEEGQPEGRAEAHWFKALELANAEAAPVAKPRRKTAAATKTAAPRKKSAK